MSGKNDRPWSDDERDRLAEMAASGYSLTYMAKKLGRTYHSVASAVWRAFPVTGNQKKTRRFCRKCDLPFVSEGPHNRLCETCRKANTGKYLMDPYHVALGQRSRSERVGEEAS